MPELSVETNTSIKEAQRPNEQIAVRELKVPTKIVNNPEAPFEDQNFDNALGFLNLHKDIQIDDQIKGSDKDPYIDIKAPADKIIPGPKGSYFISPPKQNPDVTLLVYYPKNDSLENRRTTFVSTDNKKFQDALKKHNHNILYQDEYLSK